jgi:hypothetical protein
MLYSARYHSVLKDSIDWSESVSTDNAWEDPSKSLGELRRHFRLSELLAETLVGSYIFSPREWSLITVSIGNSTRLQLRPPHTCEV